MSKRERDDSPVTRPETQRVAPHPLPVWVRRLQASARQVPKWTWLSGGMLAVLITILLLYFALRSAPGWTLVIRAVPADSEVFVDEIRRGVTMSDGTVQVRYLMSGTGGKDLIVRHAGYIDDKRRVTETEDGIPITVTLTPVQAELRDQIDYHGLMMLVRAGQFLMGDNDHEENERPAHFVEWPDYYIDKYEVSNAEYKKFCEATGRPLPVNPPGVDPSLRVTDYLNAFPDLPVIGISWDDAVAYATSVGKRLPTEQEWEKAASWAPDAKSKRLWPWGNSFSQEHANVGTDRATPVMSFPTGASGYGVLNMAGNASEWVNDYYQPYPGNHGSDPKYGTGNRVIRGGSYNHYQDRVRTSWRDAQLPTTKAELGRTKRIISYIGFRCAVSADDAQLRKFLRERGQ